MAEWRNYDYFNMLLFGSGQFPHEMTVSMNGHASFGDCLPPPASLPRSILLFLFFPARRRAAAAAEIYAMYASARTTRTSQVRWWALGAAAALGRRRGETCAKLTHARALCCDFLNAFQTLFCDIFVKERFDIFSKVFLRCGDPDLCAISEILNY